MIAIIWLETAAVICQGIMIETLTACCKIRWQQAKLRRKVLYRLGLSESTLLKWCLKEEWQKFKDLNKLMQSILTFKLISAPSQLPAGVDLVLGIATLLMLINDHLAQSTWTVTWIAPLKTNFIRWWFATLQSHVTLHPVWHIIEGVTGFGQILKLRTSIL